MRHGTSFNSAFSWRSRCGRWIFCVCVALVVGFAVPGCDKKDEKPAQQARGPVEVSTVTVTPTDVPLSIEYIAQTQSSQLVNIHARVSGFLDKRVYTEGDVVKEGQVLFKMDAKPFKVQLDQALAALAMREAALETSRLNLARVKPLTKLNALSQKDLDDATGQFQSNAAAVEQAKAEVETARLNLSYCTISSPVKGATSSAQQTDGTYISTQNSLLTTVAVLSPMWVNFSLSENEMQKFHNQVAKGLVRVPEGGKFQVELILTDGSTFPHTGEITFAEPSYNAKTGTFLIRATVDNPKGLLRPNQYVRTRIKGAIRPKAILVPKRAVQQGPKGHFTWVVNPENKVQMRPVDVGDWHEDDWFIDEGLQPGDQVVVDGVLMLRPGAPVTVKPYAGPGSASPNAEAVKAKTAEGGK